MVWLAIGSIAVPALAEQNPTPGRPAAARWFLIGAASHPSVMQPIGASRALVCAEGKCSVWDPAGSGWRTTDDAPFATTDLSSVRQPSGNVVVIHAGAAHPTEIWSPASGHWTAGAAIPEPLTDARTVELADGRIVVAGDASSIRRPRAFVADPGLHAWSTFVDAPADFTNSAVLVPTSSGALLFFGESVWRHTSGHPGWKAVSFADAAPSRSSLLLDWGDDVLLVMQRRDERQTVLVGADGKLRSATSLPYANDGFGLIPVATASGPRMWLVVVGETTYLWRRFDEALIQLPATDIRPFSKVVALDDHRLLGVDPTGAVMLLALDGEPPPGNPCDGLLRYLTQTPFPSSPAAPFDLVDPRCREAARRGEAGPVLAVVRRLVDEPEGADAGWAFECSLQDDRAINRLSTVFTGEKKGNARAVCYQSLTSWPAAEGLWKVALDHAVYPVGDFWQVDPALDDLARVAPPEVRERLVPVLRSAVAHHAGGFDALRDAVCAPEATMSIGRRQSCAELASLHDAQWYGSAAPAADQAPGQPSHIIKGTAVLLAATAVVAGAVVASHSTRDETTSRVIATASGALGGATIGVASVALASTKGKWFSRSGHPLTTALGVGFVAGGVLGGLAAHALTSSPSSRAPVTGASLALPWLLTVTLGFE